MRRSPSPISTKNDSYRQSLLSTVSPSATSFKTAPLSPTRSSSSSIRTVVRDPDTLSTSQEVLNPIYTLATSQEVHIIKVTASDTVQPPPHPPPPPIVESSTSTSTTTGNKYLSPDYLVRPTRRNTTGSTAAITSKKPPSNSHNKNVSQPNAVHDDTTLGEGSIELANDIELHAERIRQERMSKRAKQRSAPATAIPEMPLVGNLIGEDHVNYVLMYNMLTGIRIGVRFFIFFLL